MISDFVSQVCELARFCGQDGTWTQGAGGNVSFVDGDTLWVKRSGMRLREMRDASDFLPLPRETVRGLLHRPDADARLAEMAPAAPSVESFFHAMLGPVTAHTHLVGSWVLSDPGAGLELSGLSARLGMFAARVPYAAPGAALGRAVALVLPPDVPASGVLLLQNHGVIAWGKDAGTVRQILTRVDAEIRRLLGVSDEPVPDVFEVGEFSPDGVSLRVLPEFAPLCREALQRPLTPDAALHMGLGPSALPGGSIALGRLSWRAESELLYVCATPEILENAVEIFAAQCIARKWAGRSLAFLPDEDVHSLLAWGAGKYGGARSP